MEKKPVPYYNVGPSHRINPVRKSKQSARIGGKNTTGRKRGNKPADEATIFRGQYDLDSDLGKFIVAVDKFKKDNAVLFLSNSQYFQVMMDLGYRKPKKRQVKAKKGTS